MKIPSQYLGFGVLLLMGLILAFSPVDKIQTEQVSTQSLIAELQHGGQYIQADELAHWIIDKDPGYQLVDIRSNTDYEKYHIPENIHIPFEKLTSDDSKEILDNNKMIILASNGNTQAGQAWILLKQLGYNDVYILAGGLNHLVQTFTNPQKPQGSYSDDEAFKYQFRKSAGRVMMGTTIAASESSDKEKNVPKPVVRKRKKAKKKVDEGC